MSLAGCTRSVAEDTFEIEGIINLKNIWDWLKDWKEIMLRNRETTKQNIQRHWGSKPIGLIGPIDTFLRIARKPIHKKRVKPATVGRQLCKEPDFSFSNLTFGALVSMWSILWSAAFSTEMNSSPILFLGLVLDLPFRHL